MAMDGACEQIAIPLDGNGAFANAIVQPATALFDLTHLRRYTGGSEDLEREILGLFCAEVPGYLVALSTARTPKDWHMAAHTLKGSALAVGANRLAQAAASAERAAPAEHANALTQLACAIELLLAELVRLRLA